MEIEVGPFAFLLITTAEADLELASSLPSLPEGFFLLLSLCCFLDGAFA